MGYLVVMVTFSGWLIMLSALWAFGFYSRGPDTPDEPRPARRGTAWVPLLASTEATSDRTRVSQLPGCTMEGAGRQSGTPTYNQ